jgi:hypothetical protein
VSVVEFEDAVEVIEGGDAPEPTSEDLRVVESVALPTRDIEEAVALVEAFASEDRAEELAEAVRSGRGIVLDLIRPCVGKGKGKHLYSAPMLEGNADKFEGWKMYLNHLSEAARRALGGLPRDVRDLGGLVQESWWNPDVPAEGRFGKGAVQGVVTPVPLIRELHAVDPRLVECSINATATGVKPGRVNGEKVWIVEGIESKGSVDWVTEAGAGGRVASIMEAMIEDGSSVTGVLDTLDNGTILAWVSAHRPDLMEAMKDSSDDDPDDDDDDAVKAAKLLKSGDATSMSEALAMVKANAKKKSAGDGGSTKGVSEAATEGDDEVAEVTPEALTEALASDEGQAALAPVIASAVVEAVRSLDLGTEVVALVESKLDEDRKVFRAEAAARADRQGELRDLRDLAHRKIDESTLSPRLKDMAKGKFDIIEGAPTADLDLVADEDEDGKVVKSAETKVTEAVTAEIADGKAIMAEINPTRVRGQGAGKEALKESAEGGNGEGEGAKAAPSPMKSLLEGVGIKGDPKEVYARSL